MIISCRLPYISLMALFSSVLEVLSLFSASIVPSIEKLTALVDS
jgi:hypothetical protein